MKTYTSKEQSTSEAVQDGAAAQARDVRRRNRRLGVALAFLMLSLGSSFGQAAEDEAGAALVEAKGCVACHGKNGVATAPSYPNLAGQWERYLRLQLMAYRSGKRKNEIMYGFAQSLTDDEIRALARFYGDG